MKKLIYSLKIGIKSSVWELGAGSWAGTDMSKIQGWDNDQSFPETIDEIFTCIPVKIFE